ncbi:ATP synthase subunit d, mitochondrial [Grifola frondosa]|uniref:ATP synthase subunit d, mitochondrial n=1 Tax=Grifola frondosa TaxID=5627 RepID=A0A1C7M9X3_GRIFR|nr:ATP synthase subunit d, mitochondrial [Grifola frondosa]
MITSHTKSLDASAVSGDISGDLPTVTTSPTSYFSSYNGLKSSRCVGGLRPRVHLAWSRKGDHRDSPGLPQAAYGCPAHPRSAVIDDAEKLLREFKPVTYDVSSHIKAIETFEVKAVAKAKETTDKIDVELKELQATLANIEDARPFEDLTVEEVGEAHPRIVEAVENMIKKGKWTVPGYKEKFGDLSLM